MRKVNRFEHTIIHSGEHGLGAIRVVKAPEHNDAACMLARLQRHNLRYIRRGHAKTIGLCSISYVPYQQTRIKIMTYSIQ